MAIYKYCIRIDSKIPNFCSIWYLSRDNKLSPEIDFLQNALNQTGHNTISAHEWKKEILQKGTPILEKD